MSIDENVYLSAIYGCLIHSLDDGGTGTENDEKVQHEGVAPSMRDLMPQDSLLFLAQRRDSFEAIFPSVHSCEKSTLSKCVAVFVKSLLVDELVDVG